MGAAAILIVAGAFMAAMALREHVSNTRLQRAIEHARAAGIAVTQPGGDAQKPDVDAYRRGSLVKAAATIAEERSLTTMEGDSELELVDWVVDPKLGAVPGPRVRELLARFAADNVRERALTDILAGQEAVHLLRFKAPADGVVDVNNEVAELADLSDHVERFAWADLVAGNPDGAIGCVRRMLRLARLLSDIRDPEAFLCRLRTDARAIDLAERLLADHEFTGEELQPAQADLALESRDLSAADYVASLTNEVIMWAKGLPASAYAVGLEQWRQDQRRGVAAGAHFWQYDQCEAKEQYARAIGILAATYQVTKDTPRKQYEWMTSRPEMHVPEAEEINESLKWMERKVQARTVLVPPEKDIFGAVARAMEATLSEIAHIRTAEAAVAAERYRLARGRWPESLEDLVGGFIEAIPTDPYTGDAIKLKADGEGLVVYSVGENGVDDGGDLKDRTDAQGHSRPADIGFQLLAPATRGKGPG
jgi:hypothetical protein